MQANMVLPKTIGNAKEKKESGKSKEGGDLFAELFAQKQMRLKDLEKENEINEIKKEEKKKVKVQDLNLAQFDLSNLSKLNLEQLKHDLGSLEREKIETTQMLKIENPISKEIASRLSLRSEGYVPGGKFVLPNTELKLDKEELLKAQDEIGKIIVRSEMPDVNEDLLTEKIMSEVELDLANSNSQVKKQTLRDVEFEIKQIVKDELSKSQKSEEMFVEVIEKVNQVAKNKNLDFKINHLDTLDEISLASTFAEVFSDDFLKLRNEVKTKAKNLDAFDLGRNETHKSQQINDANFLDLRKVLEKKSKDQNLNEMNSLNSLKENEKKEKSEFKDFTRQSNVLESKLELPKLNDSLKLPATAENRARNSKNEILETVSQNTKILSNIGGGVAKIRIYPEELGEVNLKIKTIGNQVEVEIKTDHPEIQKIIEGGLDKLEASLKSENLKLAKVDVMTQISSGIDGQHESFFAENLGSRNSSKNSDSSSQNEQKSKDGLLSDSRNDNQRNFLEKEKRQNRRWDYQDWLNT